VSEWVSEWVEQLMETLTFLCHSTIILATQIHDTIFFKQFTIMLQKTEINHTIDLCVKAANKEHKL